MARRNEVIQPGGTVVAPGLCLSNLVNGCAFDTSSTITLFVQTICIDSDLPDCPQITATYTIEYVLSQVGSGHWRYRTTDGAGNHDTEVFYQACNGGDYMWSFTVDFIHLPGYTAGNPPTYAPCTGTSPGWTWVASGSTLTDPGCTPSETTLTKADPPLEDPCSLQSSGADVPGNECCIQFLAAEGTLNTCAEQTKAECAGFRCYYRQNTP